MDTWNVIKMYLCKPKAESIICCDINTDFLTENRHKQCLISLLTWFNLTSTVKFPTRIQHGSSTDTDNVFIESTREDYSKKPVINGLPNHDAQLIVIHNMKPAVSNYNCREQSTLINDLTINEFTTPLRNQNLKSVYNSHGLDLKLNTFLKIFLGIF
jgi:hypothetical protein